MKTIKFLDNLRTLTFYKSKRSNVSSSVNDFYKVLFDRNELPILVVDPEGGSIDDANLSAIKFYGYTKEILLSKTIYDINQLTKDEINQKMNSVVETNEGAFYFKHITNNGDIKDVQVDSIKVTIMGKEFIYSIITDITQTNIERSFFDTLFEQSPYSIAILDMDYRIVNINENFKRLFQYKAEEVIGLTPHDVIYPDSFKSNNTLQGNINKIEETGLIKVETERRRKDGTPIQVELISFPIFNKDQHISTYVLYLDQTKQYKVKKQNQLLANVLKNNSEGVMITNPSKEIEWVNEAFSEITGYKKEEVLGKTPSLLQSGLHDKDFYQHMWEQITTQGVWSGEIWNKNKQGKLYPEWLKIFSINDTQNEIANYVGILSDISEKKEWEERIDNLIYNDNLTGLYNRFYITKTLDCELQNAAKEQDDLVVIYCDIDQFKNINDSLGHSVGDLVLRAFSSKLLKTFDQSLVGRIGGDEFVIIMNGQLTKYATTKLNDFIDELKSPFYINEHELYIQSSFGIARFPKDGIDTESMLMSADIAMYKAKETSGSHFEFYTDILKDSIHREFMIRNFLNRAIESDEFILHYQPIIDLKSLSIVGSEALIRWNQPNLGFLAPVQFIPIAERTGDIDAIGKWVLKEACIQTKKWQEDGFGDLSISVNISVKQLENKLFSHTVIKTLNEVQLSPEYLYLEITEESSISDSIKIQENYNKLTEFGVHFSVDDFGTGYSSLSKLNELRIDQLKSDKSFIDDLEVSKKIVDTILSIGKNLNLSVVAEGIETKEQLQYLIGNGCDLGQGYLFSKPKSSLEYEKMLKRNYFKSFLI
ncbi:GGDEF domain-containing protein [Paraliobacillus quinghaiensis]|uniref:GGDEF domain-containing protein n=1 Tax=Paraliobacillus quinghaiensis TaxID=470815 RepID=A0A917TIH1_9BACI|nr:EAL domain-containing protein [Paraliobacillus quinghaiensis]GGM23543.1 GGDEF domain-containing protein [Paraliobacillus quinghaiensis]